MLRVLYIDIWIWTAENAEYCATIFLSLFATSRWLLLLSLATEKMPLARCRPCSGRKGRYRRPTQSAVCVLTLAKWLLFSDRASASTTLTNDASRSLVQTFIRCRLDYGNGGSFSVRRTASGPVCYTDRLMGCRPPNFTSHLLSPDPKPDLL